MTENLPEFIFFSITIIITVFANMRIIGYINEAMEMLEIKMRRVKIPLKFMPFVHLFGEKVEPFPDNFRPEVYILTVILTIVSYIYEVLTVAAAITVFILIPDIILYIFFAPAIYSIMLAAIMQIYKIKIDRRDRKNFMRLVNDFTISGDTAEKSRPEEQKEDISVKGK